MTSETPGSDIRKAWQAQAPSERGLSASEVARQVDRLTRRARLQNAAGLAVCVIMLLVCGWWLAWIVNPLARAGALLTAIGTGLLAWQLQSNRHTTGAALARSVSAGELPTLAFHRDQLCQLRDFHRGWPFWTRLVILVLGGLMFSAGFAGAHPEVAATMRLEALGLILLAVAAVWLNLRLARGYQRQLDKVNQVGKD